MNKSAVISTRENQVKQVIIPSFFSLRAEAYFFHEILPNLDLETPSNNNEYQFEIVKDSRSELLFKKQLAIFKELGEGGHLTIFPLYHPQYGFSKNAIFTDLINNDLLNIQQGHYILVIFEGVIAHLKTLKALHYKLIDWQVMELLNQKYSKRFYKFLKITYLSDITEFACDWEKVKLLFGIDENDCKKWKKHQSEFLEDARQEISQHPTHPIFFDYSTHESFDTNLKENRKSPYLYFRILGEG